MGVGILFPPGLSLRALRLLEESQRDAALGLVVQDPLRVIRTDAAAGGPLLVGGHRPGLVDLAVRDAGQLRYEAADVGALRVEPLRLEDGVEDPEVRRRVRSAARDPLPAAVVVGEVGVGELALEPGFAPLPVDVEV